MALVRVEELFAIPVPLKSSGPLRVCLLSPVLVLPCPASDTVDQVRTASRSTPPTITTSASLQLFMSCICNAYNNSWPTALERPPSVLSGGRCRLLDKTPFALSSYWEFDQPGTGPRPDPDSDPSPLRKKECHFKCICMFVYSKQNSTSH